MDYFSDRELGGVPQINEQITIPVWNGLCSIIQQFVANNALACKFPLQCPDNMGICGCDDQLLNDNVQALIPSLGIPVERIGNNDLLALQGLNITDIHPYAVLDLIELIYKNLSDPVQESYHKYFSHYHLKFENRGENQEEFKSQVNELFRRNGIAYMLNDNGQITRVIPNVIQAVISQKITTSDERLNELLSESIQNISSPPKENRIKALERIWDAFERLKTYLGTDKKSSIEKILVQLSKGNELLKDYLETECKTLTDIGNKFQIRHFEQNKAPITDECHIDYLYFRIFSFIHLFITSIDKSNLQV